MLTKYHTDRDWTMLELNIQHSQWQQDNLHMTGVRWRMKGMNVALGVKYGDEYNTVNYTVIWHSSFTSCNCIIQPKPDWPFC